MARRVSALFLALAGAACGGEQPPQLLRGSIERDPMSASVDHVKAWSSQGLAALAPLSSDGSFILALPVGGPYRLELADRLGKSVLPFAEPSMPISSPVLKVCEPGPVHELGLIHLVALGCAPGLDCPSAQRQLFQCKRDPQQYCAELGRMLDACRDQPPCDPAAPGMPPDPNGCMDPCTNAQIDFQNRCSTPCEQEAQLADGLCGDAAGTGCGLPPAALTEEPLPIAFGCFEEENKPRAGM